MPIKLTTWVALAASAAILALAWLMTDELAGWVSLPLLMGLMAGGLLIAREKTAPGASVFAGAVCAIHACILLAGGHHNVPLSTAYLVSGLLLAGCGIGLRGAFRAVETQMPLP